MAADKGRPEGENLGAVGGHYTQDAVDGRGNDIINEPASAGNMHAERRMPLCVPVGLLADRTVRAALDLRAYADRLAAVAAMPPSQHARGLFLLNGFGARLYCFERNLTRWPDGKFYLLDREYQPWKHNKIGFTLEELKALGVIDWYRSTGIAYTEDTWPLQADDFPRSRSRFRVPQYSALVARIADQVEAAARRVIEEHAQGRDAK